MAVAVYIYDVQNMYSIVKLDGHFGYNSFENNHTQIEWSRFVKQSIR